MRNDLTEIFWVQYSDAIMIHVCAQISVLCYGFVEKIIRIEYNVIVFIVFDQSVQSVHCSFFFLRTDQAKNNKKQKRK